MKPQRSRHFFLFLCTVIVGLGTFALESQAQAGYTTAGQIACHNCYEPQFAPSWVKALDHTKVLEIDFWPDNGLWSEKDHDFYVRHGGTNLEFGNVHNCSGEGFLSDCLGDLRVWHDQHPNHPTITVFLDIKQVKPPYLGAAFDPAVLEQLLSQKFAGLAFKPSELSRDEAGKPRWPVMSGKFVFVLTGGYHFNRTETMVNYLNHSNDPQCFVAADVTSAQDYQNLPEQLRSNLAFINVNAMSAQPDLKALISEKGLLARAWSTEPDKMSYWNKMVDIGITFIALYDFKRKPLS